MQRKGIYIWVLSLVYITLTSCVSKSVPTVYDQKKEYAPTYPCYQDSIVIPPNIAPLNFQFTGEIQEYRVKLEDWIIAGKKDVLFPIQKWKDFLGQHKEKTIKVEIWLKEKEQWYKYKDLHWRVSKEEIDPYLSSRMGLPEDGEYGILSISERNIQNFDTRFLLKNTLMKNNCMNCHTYWQNDASHMMVHLRGEVNGTLLIHQGKVQLLQIPKEYSFLRFTYPCWHPGGEIIAFSTNRVSGIFHNYGAKREINMIDTLGNIIVYDIKTNKIYSSPELMDNNYEDLHPAWDIDGKTLYFCRTPNRSPDSFPTSLDRVRAFKFDLMKVVYNSQDHSFTKPQCVYSFSKDNKSVTIPHVSPNGRYLLITVTPNSSLPAPVHGDLYLMPLKPEPGIPQPIENINSEEAETFHSWSSNGHWIVFSSKKMDGQFARPHFAYFDGKGGFSKSFVLPQKSPDFYKTNRTSFLMPYLSKNTCPYKIDELTRDILDSTKVLYPDASYFDKYKVDANSGASIPASGH